MYTRSIKYIKLNNFSVTIQELKTRVAMPVERQDQSRSNSKKCSQINYNPLHH